MFYRTGQRVLVKLLGPISQTQLDQKIKKCFFESNPIKITNLNKIVDGDAFVCQNVIWHGMTLLPHTATDIPDI